MKWPRGALQARCSCNRERPEGTFDTEDARAVLQESAARRGHRLMFGAFLGETEIDDFDFRVGVRRREEQILTGETKCAWDERSCTDLGFEISMAEIVTMHEVHRGDELLHQLTGFFLREGRLRANPVEQFAAREQLHDDIRVQLNRRIECKVHRHRRYEPRRCTLHAI